MPTRRHASSPIRSTVLLAAASSLALACGGRTDDTGGGRPGGAPPQPPQPGDGDGSDGGASSTGEGDVTSGGGDDTATSDGGTSDGGDSDGGGSDGGSGSDDSGGGPSRFDIEVPTDPGDPGEMEGCQKVDFLFVIDSSNSMATNQAELIRSFPEFVTEIQTTLAEVESYHVGVVSSDAYPFNEPGCTMVGSLVTQTGGVNSSAQVCAPYALGARYMTEQDDLATTFACAAQVGTGGDNNEQMMAAATRAIAPDMNAPGACNEGFIRDDALLVLVLITDEDDPGSFGNTGSGGDPNSWLADILAVKGAQENVVALALVRGIPGNVCGFPQGSEKNGDRLMQFTGLLGPNGLDGDICANSFGPFFNQAVNLIDTACDGFKPPG